MDVDWVNQRGIYYIFDLTALLNPYQFYFLTAIIFYTEQKMIRQKNVCRGKLYTSSFHIQKLSPLSGASGQEWLGTFVCTDRTSEIIKPCIFPNLSLLSHIFLVIMVLSICSIIYGSSFLRRNNKTLIHLVYYDKPTGSFNRPRFARKFQSF